MDHSNSLPSQQQDNLLSAFMEMVTTFDGDFSVLDKLAQASSDRHSLDLIIQHLSQHPHGKKAFETRQLLGDIDLEELANLSPLSLGYCYAEHMKRNQLKPLQAKTVENDYQFLGANIIETHDIWHVLTHSDTSILGEMKLEAFSLAQLAFSRFWLSLLAKNLLKASLYEIEVSGQYMDVITEGWLMGKKAKLLFGIDWNKLWEVPLKKVQTDLNIQIEN